MNEIALFPNFHQVPSNNFDQGYSKQDENISSRRPAEGSKSWKFTRFQCAKNLERHWFGKKMENHFKKVAYCRNTQKGIIWARKTCLGSKMKAENLDRILSRKMNFKCRTVPKTLGNPSERIKR